MPTGVYERTPCASGCSCGKHRRGTASAETRAKISASAKYNAWVNMRARCLRPSHPRYADWGGRGITVCQRWLVFESFLADMGRRPSAEHQLDRIDNDGNYEPGNCRWATTGEQAANKRPRGPGRA